MTHFIPHTPLPPLRSRTGSLLLAGILLPLGLLADSSLIEKSPFLPPDFQASGSAPIQRTTPEAARNDLSLNGVFQIAGQYRFNIHDRQAGRGVWVGENDASAPYLVTHYDRENRSATVQTSGQTVNLTLQSPSDNPMAVNVAPMSNPGLTAPPERTAGQRRVVVPPRRVVQPPAMDSASEPRRPRMPPPPPPRPRPTN